MMSEERSCPSGIREVENLYRKMVEAAKIFEAKSIISGNGSTSQVLDLAQKLIGAVDAILPSQHDPRVQSSLTKYRLYAMVAKEHYSPDGCEKKLPPEQSLPCLLYTSPSPRDS